MKKLILLLSISLLGTGFLSAEREFQSVLNNGMARWSMVSLGFTSSDAFEIIVTDNDTLINDVLYRKIYYNFFPRCFADHTDWQNYIPDVNNDRNIMPHCNLFIRESEDASRLYIFDMEKNTEIVVFDLNLEVGDEFVFILPWWWGWGFYNGKTAAYVDSVFIKDGLKHISFDRYLWSGINNYMKLMFIEGVGPNIGITTQISSMTGHSMVNCFSNDVLFYRYERRITLQSDFFYYHPFSCGCSLGSNVFEIDRENCNVWLESGNLIIACKEIQNAQVSIYSVLGRYCFSGSFSGLQQISIPTTHLPRGVYTLRVRDKDTNRVYAGRIIL